MVTEKQQSAAHQNIKKAQTASRKGGMDRAKRDSLEESTFEYDVAIEANSWRELVK
ncbi:MAG: hypothetical protein M3019_01850 [Candidatus Dormibacteraeota bacterium]|nr:hypothetical protein [Candidatus Dormibacteraeota bacterium]